MYEVKTAEFSGPMEKLAELIETKKLDITRLSLAEVTADFLAFLADIKKEVGRGERTLNKEEVALLADFLVIASRLILIKSKALLPSLEISDEEERDINELETRLASYARCKPLFGKLAVFWKKHARSFPREVVMQKMAGFYPPKDLKSEYLLKALGDVVRRAEPFIKAQDTITREEMSMEDAIATIGDIVKRGMKKFSDIIDTSSRAEAVVSFLALLHLLRESVLVVHQEALFGDITITMQS